MKKLLEKVGRAFDNFIFLMCLLWVLYMLFAFTLLALGFALHVTISNR